MRDAKPLKTDILPWEDIIICVEPPEDVSEGGVVLADTEDGDKKKPEKGIVVAIGPLGDKTKKLPIALEVGDLIFYERYTSNRIPDKGILYNFVRTKFVMGAKKIGK